MLNVASPFLLICCGLNVEGSRGWGRFVEGSRGAFGGVLQRCLDSSLSVVVGSSAFVWGVGSFCGAVSEVGVVSTSPAPSRSEGLW